MWLVCEIPSHSSPQPLCTNEELNPLNYLLRKYYIASSRQTLRAATIPSSEDKVPSWRTEWRASMWRLPLPPLPASVPHHPCWALIKLEDTSRRDTVMFLLTGPTCQEHKRNQHSSKKLRKHPYCTNHPVKEQTPFHLEENNFSQLGVTERRCLKVKSCDLLADSLRMLH